jgi:hypothetical protein
MKLIADTVLSHRNKAGQTYFVQVGEEFEIADEDGEILIAAKEAHKRRPGEAKKPIESTGDADPATDHPPTDPHAKFAAGVIDQSAEKAIAAIGEIADVTQLRAVGTAEAAGKNRSTVISAVLEREAVLTQPPSP